MHTARCSTIPGLIAACVVGDGEAETGPLATSWHSNKFLNPARDGAVLPILHLNGYKIAGPTVLARISRTELSQLFRGYGYEPFVVEGDDPASVHAELATALDIIVARIQEIQHARANAGRARAGRLADDHFSHAEGMDRAGDGGRRADRGDVPLPIRCR